MPSRQRNQSIEEFVWSDARDPLLSRMLLNSQATELGWDGTEAGLRSVVDYLRQLDLVGLFEVCGCILVAGGMICYERLERQELFVNLSSWMLQFMSDVTFLILLGLESQTPKVGIFVEPGLEVPIDVR